MFLTSISTDSIITANLQDPLTVLTEGLLYTDCAPVAGITYTHTILAGSYSGLIIKLTLLWPQLARPLSETSRVVLTPINTVMRRCPNVYNIHKLFLFILHAIMN